MGILQNIRLSFKKVKFNKAKSLFVILPIAMLITLIVIASSEAVSLINVAGKNIFSSIEAQNQVLELNKNSFTRQSGGGSFFTSSQSSTDSSYTNNDIGTIDSVNNVTGSSLIAQIPIKNISTTDLFSGKSVSFSDLAGLDSTYASIYTNQTFDYTEGDTVIPIILNANDFIENYQDWQGKDEINVDFSKLRAAFTPGQAPTTDPLTDQSPDKTKAISYTKEELIGKTFTINFGGLDTIQNYTRESTSTGFKYVKKTDDTIASETETRKNDIAQYWDYTKIATPLTYTFKIVGIAEGTDKTKTYIPTVFAQKVLKDYLQNAISARNTTSIATTDLNSKYLGLTYDGVSLKNDTQSQFLSGIRRQIGGQVENFRTQRVEFNSGTAQATPDIKIVAPDSSSGYNIPGLVLNQDRTTSTITGEYTGFDLSSDIPLDSTTILIKINDVNNRSQVINDLNSAGFTYQDSSKVREFQRLQSYLNTGLSVGSIIFMVITALFILINMAKFVSESRKEIGIFRAIGATKMKIRSIIIIQSLMYIVLSIILGLLTGCLIIFAISSIIVNFAQQFINSTVGGILTINGTISRSDFLNIDYKTIGIYIVVLLIVSMIVSLWPAEQAAKVSPVEAIRN